MLLSSLRLLLLPALVIVANAQQSELFEAARLGDLPTLQALAGDKAAVDMRGPHDRTALHEAAANCQFEAAKILTSQNRPPSNLIANCPDNVRTAFYLLLRPPIQEKDPWSLQYAAAHRPANVVAMLVRMGTDVNAIGSEGNRVLELSCLHGDAATAGFLLEHGAHPNLRNKVGSTPLHDAALTGNKEVVELLLEHGANINALDSESASTPLHYAASFGHLDVVKLLVQHGADTTLRSTAGFTALRLATRNDFADVAAFLGERKPK
jgi:26S proteasome non-ATPase regulatory subunit 10